MFYFRIRFIIILHKQFDRLTIPDENNVTSEVVHFYCCGELCSIKKTLNIWSFKQKISEFQIFQEWIIHYGANYLFVNIQQTSACIAIKCNVGIYVAHNVESLYKVKRWQKTKDKLNYFVKFHLVECMQKFGSAGRVYIYCDFSWKLEARIELPQILSE